MVIKQLLVLVTDLKFKTAAFRIKNLKGKNDNGQVKLDFLPAKYLQKQNIKSYDFASFSNGIAESDDGAINSNYKKDDNFNSEEGPIKMNTSKLNFNFNSSDAIINKKGNNFASNLINLYFQSCSVKADKDFCIDSSFCSKSVV